MNRRNFGTGGRALADSGHGPRGPPPPTGRFEHIRHRPHNQGQATLTA